MLLLTKCWKKVENTFYDVLAKMSGSNIVVGANPRYDMLIMII
jgi:hypothetical protein